jgi:FKBP-type peptidyl-prolyl cis-trans isomerase FklB
MEPFFMKKHVLVTMLMSLVFSVSHAQANNAQTAASVAPLTMSATNIADENAKAGAAFLAENKNKAGVVTLADGLQYKIVASGLGKKPSKDDTVTVDYEGKFINGEIFDSSYKRGEPVSFPVSAVIPGWTEALQLMNTGSTWVLYIPASLAYGERGMPSAIGPNETLIFKVHLISVK